MMRSILAGLLLAAPSAEARASERVPIGDDETVAFYGDSITEQNLYAEYLETFLLSRFPTKRIACFNFGWGGDTAAGGDKRWRRDAAPVKPTLVFVDFGMNDGGYRPYDEAVARRYLADQRALAADIRRGGAREVLLAPTPVDEDIRKDGGAYNDALSRMGRGLMGLADELKVPSIDLFQPMREAMAAARKREPGATLIPDAVHPNAAGHLVMAYAVMRGLDAPRGIGDVVVREGRPGAADGVKIAGVTRSGGGLEFELTPPFLPFYVPPEARSALSLIPFEDEVNRFRLRVEDAAEGDWTLSADGVTLGTFSAQRLREGVDLALLEKAPWSAAGRTLWEAAQARWEKHFEAWRRMGLDRPAKMMPDLPSFRLLARAQRAYSDELGRALRRLAKPRAYRIGLWPAGERVSISSGELSPAYPSEGFEKAYPPELAPNAVAWKKVSFEDGKLDLAQQLGPLTDVVSYTRIALDAEAPCALHLAMGSDDGLAVVADGKRVFSHDVRRGLHPGEDETDVSLHSGRNELLFMVTQAGGEYALAVEAQVRGRVRGRQIEPR